MTTPHSCPNCSKFTVHLFDRISERRNTKPVWDHPNASQRQQARLLFGEYVPSLEYHYEYKEFFRTSDGISFFDTDIDELKSFAEAGCALSYHLVRCLTKDDSPPASYALGVHMSTSYSLEFLVYDFQNWSWETLLGPEDDEEPDNVYTILAPSDISAAEIIENRPINLTPISDSTLRQARGWLDECMQNHDECQKPDTSFTPTRLVEIIPKDFRSAFRLCETGSQYRSYAALSYCWGGDQAFKTTLKSLPAYLEEIPEDLPQTLLDAIYVATQLGLRYVWIDALCIIQDSDEDKATEIGQMARVYSNATITIAGTRAKAVREGFLGDRPAVRLPNRHFSLPSQHNGQDMGFVTLVPSTHESVDPLDSRGWCYQERVLSPRVLDFGSLRTQYTCKSRNQSSSDGWSNLPIERAYGAYLDSEIMSGLIAGQYTPEAMQVHWFQVVQGFTTRGLSFMADKLPAIAGMAECFGSIMQDQYCAGIWRGSMPLGLLWHVRSSELQPRLSKEQVGAPSWSWAAVSEAITYNPLYTGKNSGISFNADLVSCNTVPSSLKSVYGATKSGKLKLSAHARRAQWTRWSRYGAVDMLLAAEACNAPDEDDEMLSFTIGSSMGLTFKPDAIEENFSSDPKAIVDTVLLLLGTLDPNPQNEIFPTVFGLVVRRVDGLRDVFSRVGLFQKVVSRRTFNNYLDWFKDTEKKVWTIT